MGIRQRLTKQRYGEMNIKAPTKVDLDDYGLRTTKLRKPVPELFDKVIYQLQFPPIRDRYFLTYIYTVNKYLEDLSMATKQSVWQSRAQIIDIHLSGKLLYMNMHPSQFHGFHNFKYTWLFDSKCLNLNIGGKFFRGDI